MNKDKACISAVKEVCQRCHLYKENCGILDYPDQCSISGRYIDGYHQAEKDLALTWEDIKKIEALCFRVDRECDLEEKEYYQEVLKRFKAKK
jgi:hypothetical protein